MIQLQLTKTMKPSQILGIASLLIIAIATVLVVMAFYRPEIPTQQLSAAAALHAQIVTPTPTAQGGVSVIGSTDGIVVMGFVIVIIIVTPLLFRKKNK